MMKTFLLLFLAYAYVSVVAATLQDEKGTRLTNARVRQLPALRYSHLQMVRISPTASRVSMGLRSEGSQPIDISQVSVAGLDAEGVEDRVPNAVPPDEVNHQKH